jgi:hypothetical protein
MKPTASDVHVNTPLTNISIAFLQNAANFVAARVFPNIPVQKQSDRYYTYDRGEFNRDQMQLRAPATESAGGGYTVDNTPTYYCHKYGLHKDIDDETRSNADSVVKMDSDAANFLSHQALIKREKLWVSKYFTTTVWTTDITGVSAAPTSGQVLQWNDGGSTPVEDIEAGKVGVMQSTGFEPNTLVLGYSVWSQLKNHPDIVDRVKGGATSAAPGKVNLANFAELIEIPNVYVMKAIENTALEGATNSHSFIGGKKALLCYAAPNPGLMTPSAGYTFSWTGLLGSGPEGNRIKKMRLELKDADRIELDMAFDQKLIAADLGYFFNSVVA